MGAYAGMEMNAMAAMLYGQRAEPWHASADIWGSACQQLLSTHGDLGAANAVIKAWPQSIGSASHAAFDGKVVGSLASLAEWSAYTGTMSAALRLGGTALNAAQGVMPALQSGYDTAVALSGVPFIGPFAAQVAVAIKTVGSGMMEAVGAVMQAPTAVQAPQQGWQGAGENLATATSPITAASVTEVLDAADKLVGLVEKGATLAETVVGLAESANLGNTGDLSNLGNLGNAGDVPNLAGGSSAAGIPSFVPTLHQSPQLPSGVSPSLVAGLGLGAGIGGLAGTAMLGGARGGAAQSGTGVPGTRIGNGTEPALAGSSARAAAGIGAGRMAPMIAPPMSPGGGGGGGTADVRSGGRTGPGGKANEQEEKLRRAGVQSGLQGRAARESVAQFGLTSLRRRRRKAGTDSVLDEELFVTESDSGDIRNRRD